MLLAPFLAVASLFGWCVLALGRGFFWKSTPDLHRCAGNDRDAEILPRVEAVVPARNEAETIGRAAASLVAQRYDGPFSMTIVDDHSDDATGSIARAVARDAPGGARLHVAAGRDLTAPWTGKLNALDAGIAIARRERGEPDFWLFTDADIEHDPENLAELVRKAQRDRLDLVSLMVHLRCESDWERLLVPAFVFFFQKLYPFSWANDATRSTAAAAGGCVLLRASALERIGGLRAIADRLIDDCALADAVKSSGGSIWIGLTSRTTSIREYGTLTPFWMMVKRTAFTQLNSSYAATALAAAAMAFLYLVPPALTVLGVARRDIVLAVAAGAAYLLMAALYTPTLRLYGRPRREALLLPVAAALYAAMTLDSALAHARGRGGVWKGRISHRAA